MYLDELPDRVRAEDHGEEEATLVRIDFGSEHGVEYVDGDDRRKVTRRVGHVHFALAGHHAFEKASRSEEMRIGPRRCDLAPRRRRGDLGKLVSLKVDRRLPHTSRRLRQNGDDSLQTR